jgi:hypothetical protein
VLGTNPWAVQELAKALNRDGQDGWERIHLLDNLHAKLYLGSDAAVWGSANLSCRGLSGDQLVELCTYSSAPEHLNDLRAFFEETLRQARTLYWDVSSRKVRISELEKLTRQNPDLASGFSPTKAVSFYEFELLSDDQFYISWVRPDIEFPAMTNAVPQDHAQLFSDWTHILPNDAESGRWMLLWPATPTLRPSRSKNYPPRGMLVDEVIDGGASREEAGPYTTVLAQLSNRDKGISPRLPPFNLSDDRVVDALLHALAEPDLSPKMIQEDRDASGQGYSIQLARLSLPSLVERMREMLKA